MIIGPHHILWRRTRYTISIDILDETYAAMDTNNYAPERNATREEIAAALYNTIKESQRCIPQDATNASWKALNRLLSGKGF